MSCICDFITSGVTETCDNNSGGIKNIWIDQLCDVSIADSSPSGYKEPTPQTGKYYKFAFKHGVSTFGEKKAGDEANGSEYYIQTVTLKLNRREKSKREKIALLGNYRRLSIIVQDMNDKYWLIGEKTGAVLKENDAPSGTARNDHNGYVLTLEAEETEMAYEVTAAFIAALKVANAMES